MATKKAETKNQFQHIEVKDYGDPEINSLAVLLTTFDKLTSEQRLRTFKYLKSKYSKDWPSDQEGY